MTDSSEPRSTPGLKSIRESLYGALRDIAGAHLQSERANHTLQPTALVNEAWLRLREDQAVQAVGHNHFLSVASRTMRRILVDHARSKGANKRGGTWKRVTLSDLQQGDGGRAVDVLAIHEVLEQLETMSKRQAQIVELRFFGGLSMEKVSEVLGISSSTTLREWRFAQAWLLVKLDPDE